MRHNSSTPNAFLPRSWTWWTLLEWEMTRSPDTLHVLLAGFVPMAWNTASAFTVLGLTDLAWSLKSVQLVWNFFNYLFTLFWSTVLSTSTQQIFSVASATLWLSLKSQSISSRIRLHWLFIYVAFKSHTEWSYAERVSAPATMMLLTTVGTTHCSNFGLVWFGFMA